MPKKNCFCILRVPFFDSVCVLFHLDVAFRLAKLDACHFSKAWPEMLASQNWELLIREHATYCDGESDLKVEVAMPEGSILAMWEINDNITHP